MCQGETTGAGACLCLVKRRFTPPPTLPLQRLRYGLLSDRWRQPTIHDWSSTRQCGSERHAAAPPCRFIRLLQGWGDYHGRERYDSGLERKRGANLRLASERGRGKIDQSHPRPARKQQSSTRILTMSRVVGAVKSPTSRKKGFRAYAKQRSLHFRTKTVNRITSGSIGNCWTKMPLKNG